MTPALAERHCPTEAHERMWFHRWLASQMLEEAVKIAKGEIQASTNDWSEAKTLRHRVWMLAWLASSRATLFFDTLRLNQEWCLRGRDGWWATHARRWLERCRERGLELPADQVRLIEDGLGRLG